MPFSEDDWLPISALQHYLFCNRRAALIHLEGLWAENRFTAEGGIVHRRAHDESQKEKRRQKRTMRGVEVCSREHGLTGKTDVIEFVDQAQGPPLTTIVEYKRGRPKLHLDAPYRIQLCAQALCVEEMLTCDIHEAFLFFAKTKQRVSVAIDAPLRQLTVSTVAQLRSMLESGRTPMPIYKPRKCKACSLLGLCLPTAPRPRRTASRYVDSLILGNSSDEA